jgi:hypothetical protein
LIIGKDKKDFESQDKESCTGTLTISMFFFSFWRRGRQALRLEPRVLCTKCVLSPHFPVMMEPEINLRQKLQGVEAMPFL